MNGGMGLVPVWIDSTEYVHILARTTVISTHDTERSRIGMSF